MTVTLNKMSLVLLVHEIPERGVQALCVLADALDVVLTEQCFNGIERSQLMQRSAPVQSGECFGAHHDGNSTDHLR
jgi:hypothetical protein